MHDHLLTDIGLAIVTAAVLGLPAMALGLPLLLAYLGAGVILGPHLGWGLIQDARSIATLSEIGLVLLMFILGLEIDLKKLLQAGKAVLINGFTQFILCALLATLYFSAWEKGSQNYEWVYLAVACSLSSTLVVVKILSDQMELDSLTSRITLGILVLQDLWAIAFLAIQPNLADLNATALVVSLSKVAILVSTSWFLARYVLPHLFSRVSKQPELMLILAMAWCFFCCGWASKLGLSMEMGALVGGIAIATFPYNQDVAAKISSLRDFFITLFFVGLGLQIPMPTAEMLTLSGLIVVFVLLSRILTVFPVLHLLGYGNRASLIPSINLSQLSEFSLVLASLGVTYQHVSADLLASFIIAMVVAALISSFAIPANHNIYTRLNPWLIKLGLADRIHHKGTDKTGDHSQAKVILLGFYRDASSLLFEMQKRFSKNFMSSLHIIDFNPEAHKKLKSMGISCTYGDISSPDFLRHAHLHESELIICTIPDQILKGTNNLKLLQSLKKIAPQARLVMTAEKISDAEEMYRTGADYVFLPRLVGAHYLVDIVERIQSDGLQQLKQSRGENFLKSREEILP